ncbi:hypothetical protein [Tsukamurella sp. USMM236]|uniref:hypothetical protein n=1 Tax=Tsukamurella sp. USMM236 TaxID=3081301 RepID=UPI00301B1AE7
MSVQPKHGAQTLAVKHRCPCEECEGYRVARRAQQRAYNNSARRALGVNQRAVALELGDESLADTVVVERVLAGIPTEVRHPDDRAAVIREVLAERISRTTAMEALHCNGSTIKNTINAYLTRPTTELEVAS